MICEQCGALLPDDVEVCDNCGYKLYQSDTAAAPETDGSEYQSEERMPALKDAFAPEQAENKSELRVILIRIFSAIMAVLTVVLFFMGAHLIAQAALGGSNSQSIMGSLFAGGMFNSAMLLSGVAYAVRALGLVLGSMLFVMGWKK